MIVFPELGSFTSKNIERKIQENWKVSWGKLLFVVSYALLFLLWRNTQSCILINITYLYTTDQIWESWYHWEFEVEKLFKKILHQIGSLLSGPKKPEFIHGENYLTLGRGHWFRVAFIFKWNSKLSGAFWKL